MKLFLDVDFLLETETARLLYHEYAARMPIIDYHCHLPVKEIAENHQYQNITQVWLNGDHYKWRAMRTNGINEKYITGDATDREKFDKWAETVPYTLRNPLYHWTHMELKKPLGIEKLLNPQSAAYVWEVSKDKLSQNEFTCRNLIQNARVEVICTTDDPIDSLKWHKILATDGYPVKVLPTWRPDKTLAVENPASYNLYLNTLSEVAGMEISTFNELLEAIQKRHNFFASVGCVVSDHGLETFYAEEYTDAEIKQFFSKVRSGKTLTAPEVLKFKSALLIELAKMNHAKGWVQQFHVGPIRNNNSRLFRQIGPDSGFDSIGDSRVAAPMAKFLDSLDTTDQLAKTILYNINPSHNEVYATMAGNFQGGDIPGKIQWGSAWWFLDQKDGMEKQMNTLSNLCLLSRFIGMLTDSRSFLSYSRHEYFHRTLCNLLGNDVENGLVPNDIPLLAQTVQDICYYNAKKYFGF